jgi:hypothetical protein
MKKNLAHDLVTEVCLNRVPDLRLAQAVRHENETLKEILTYAADYLRQYKQYSDEMKMIGRGFHPSGEFSPEYLNIIIMNVLKD